MTKTWQNRKRHVFANAGNEKLQPDPIIENENVREKGDLVAILRSTVD
jgi:hypothetical protein